MLDHVGFAVSDFSRAKAFYEAALRPLGLSLVVEVTAEETGADAHAGFGAAGKPFFWIGNGEKHAHKAAQSESSIFFMINLPLAD